MATLIDGQDGGGRRYYIGRKPLHCGTTISVRINGVWIPATFGMGPRQEGEFHIPSFGGAMMPAREGVEVRFRTPRRHR